MNYKKAIILGTLVTATLAQADTWTLDACLKQAKSKSLSLETAKLREQQAEVNVKQAKSGNRPTVSASIQNTLYDHPFVDNEDHYRLSLGISGSYTLWDGGTTNTSVEVNQLKKEAAAMPFLNLPLTVSVPAPLIFMSSRA